MEWFRPIRSRWDAATSWIWLGVFATVTSVAALLKPSLNGHGTHQELGLPPCWSVLFFHRPCPGCGLTTSWSSTVHGNLADAFRAHPLGPLLYLAFALSALLTLVALFRKQKFEFGHPWVVRSTTALVIALFVFGAIRFATTTATLNAEMPIWAQK